MSQAIWCRIQRVPVGHELNATPNGALHQFATDYESRNLFIQSTHGNSDKCKFKQNYVLGGKYIVQLELCCYHITDR